MFGLGRAIRKLIDQLSGESANISSVGKRHGNEEKEKQQNLVIGKMREN